MGEGERLVTAFVLEPNLSLPYPSEVNRMSKWMDASSMHFSNVDGLDRVSLRRSLDQWSRVRHFLRGTEAICAVPRMIDGTS